MKQHQFLLLLFISFSGLLLSCKQGTTVEIFDDGKLYEKFIVDKDSLRHGIYQRFYKSGQVAEKAIYKNGKLEGVRNLYYPDGNIEIVENYVADSLHGEYKTFHPNGHAQFVCSYVHNKVQGIAKKYYESGQIQEEVTFKDNYENGPFTEYYENGNVEWKGTFVDGDNEAGELLNYNKSGELIKRMKCDPPGVCVTEWTKESSN